MATDYMETFMNPVAMTTPLSKSLNNEKGYNSHHDSIYISYSSATYAQLVSQITHNCQPGLACEILYCPF